MRCRSVAAGAGLSPVSRALHNSVEKETVKRRSANPKAEKAIYFLKRSFDIVLLRVFNVLTKGIITYIF